MSELLFLAHRTPFPPDRGDKIRSHHVLRALTGLAPVHVGAFADEERRGEAELASLAASHHLAARTRPLAMAAVQALAAGRPVSVPAFADAGLRGYVARVLAARPIAAIYVFSSQMAQYVPARFAGRVVMDFVDVDSAKFEAYAGDSRQPLRTLYRREARLLAAWEAEAARRADVSLFVTREEAALFRERIGPGTYAAAQVRVLGNGIDSGFFDPAQAAPAPALLEQGPHLLFTGQMDYPPNVAAVARFARAVMPAIREQAPAARFHIVGRRPTEAVRALDGQAGTRVWGAVDDVRPWLAGADLVVAPLSIARGVQNKVLEAMAMARPVVASPEAATGIAARDGCELAIAGDDAALAARALTLLGDGAERRRIGEAARRFVRDQQSWATMLAGLPEIVGLAGAARHAA